MMGNTNDGSRARVSRAGRHQRIDMASRIDPTSLDLESRRPHAGPRRSEPVAMNDGARSIDLSMLRSVVPGGFANVLVLGLASIVLALTSHNRADASDLRRWVVLVWLGAALQLATLLVRRAMLLHSPDRWERVYGWIAFATSAAWAMALLIEPVNGDPLTFRLILACFLILLSAVIAACFAGSPRIGRRALAGLWMGTLIIAVDRGAPELVAIAAFVWPSSVILLALATRIVRQSAVEHQRSRDLARELATAAVTDDLTGLLNRRATLQRLQQTMDTGHGITLLFIDVDGFGQMNERYGHATGDTVLINVAEQLRSVARADDIVGRVGGDEFIVGLTNAADQHLGDLIAERVAGEISRCHGSIHELAVTGSVGTAKSIDGATAEDLLGCADAALRRAKAQGGNSAVQFLEAHLD